MKKQTGIWIDSSKAVIVTLENGKEMMSEIASDLENSVYDTDGEKGSFFGNQHVNSEKTFDERKKNHMKSYLTEIMEFVHQSDELYIFGPAEAKTKLEQRINAENATIASKLKAVETSDSMTNNQIIAQVKKFYST
jgi:NurA-like 5'-3' nuclease